MKNNECLKKQYINPQKINIGLYLKEGNGVRLQKEITKDIKKYQDLFIIGSLYTREEFIPNTNLSASLFIKYQSNYSDISNFRIGYQYILTLMDGKVLKRTMLKPSDVTLMINGTDMYQYFMPFYYDDILHQHDNFYSHVREKDFNEKTMLTSVKLWAGDKCDEIDTISMKAFVYEKKEEFDNEGNYTGDNFHEFLIRRKR